MIIHSSDCHIYHNHIIPVRNVKIIRSKYWHNVMEYVRWEIHILDGICRQEPAVSQIRWFGVNAEPQFLEFRMVEGKSWTTDLTGVFLLLFPSVTMCISNKEVYYKSKRWFECKVLQFAITQAKDECIDLYNVSSDQAGSQKISISLRRQVIIKRCHLFLNKGKKIYGTKCSYMGFIKDLFTSVTRWRIRHMTDTHISWLTLLTYNEVCWISSCCPKKIAICAAWGNLRWRLQNTCEHNLKQVYISHSGSCSQRCEQIRIRY